LADALFVIVTYFFGTLLNSYVVAERAGKSYQGRITPRNIGRRKDFWNRLNMAYNDLQMQGVLRKVKANNKFGYQEIIDRLINGKVATMICSVLIRVHFPALDFLSRMH
jgi:hypothetical protein